MSQRLSTVSSQLSPYSGPPSTFIAKGEVAIFALDNPPLNTLGKKLRKDILAAVAAFEGNPALKVMMITGKGPLFCGGADVSEFAGLSARARETKGNSLPALAPEESLIKVLDTVESCKKPIVAVVNGLAPGGGTVLALACHYRIAAPNAVFSLPEIKFGIIPAAGGTQRITRLIGVENSIAMCCSGMNVKSAKALRWGLVDVMPSSSSKELLLEEAMTFCDDLIAKKKPPRRISQENGKLPNFLMTRLIFSQARKKLAASVPKDFPAPMAALGCVEAACKSSSYREGCAREEEILLRCLRHPSAAAMQHFFFSERLATRIPGLDQVSNKNTLRSRAKRPSLVGIIGGGTMGGGIAMSFLNVGVPVILLETSEERKKFCVDTIAKKYQARVKKGKMSEDKFHNLMSRLTTAVAVEDDYSALKNADYVIEAVFENMQLKKKIFARLDQVCKPSCILASNTSTLSIDEIASATSRPHKVIGAHFFSPADVMMLLEFVRGKATDAETISTSLEVGKLIEGWLALRISTADSVFMIEESGKDRTRIDSNG